MAPGTPALRNLALEWIHQAKTRAKVSTSFGQNTWLEMHGGGTSFNPHCRPWGFYSTTTKQYLVRLTWEPDEEEKKKLKGRNKEREIVIQSFPVSFEKEPTVEEVYDALEKKMKEFD